MDAAQLTAEGYYSIFGKVGARTEMPGCSLCMGNQARIAENLARCYPPGGPKRPLGTSWGPFDGFLRASWSPLFGFMRICQQQKSRKEAKSTQEISSNVSYFDMLLAIAACS